MIRRLIQLTCLLVAASAAVAVAQDRDAKVRNDRKQFEEDASWIYNDLAKGVAEAKQSGRPMLVVFR